MLFLWFLDLFSPMPLPFFIHSLNCSATPAPSHSVLKIEPRRKSPTLNAVFTNSNRQILQVIYLNIGMFNALKFSERDAVLHISSTKSTSYSLIKKNKKKTNYLSRSSPARDQSLSSSLRSESVSEALDCSELVPRNIKQEDRDGHTERSRHAKMFLFCFSFLMHSYTDNLLCHIIWQQTRSFGFFLLFAFTRLPTISSAVAVASAPTPPTIVGASGV